ncbi:hypothetical protein GOZ84_16730 [Agrobacterium vitis]|uniref:hypothetical protein n=1 Tax=Agrobacterium vitis TaxID=373 RepID=UPI0012E916B7|nr:hypothetical protein [Agrobacterium vitis]MVA52436.1 hypothetical protein [Agrobacterium vitis]
MAKPGTPLAGHLTTGLALVALLGAIGIGASAVWTWLDQETLDHWLLSTTFTIERLLPLIGTGFILGQLPRRRLPLALLVLAAGFVAGFVWRDMWMQLLAPLPAAPSHFFLVGPLACLLAGAILVLPLPLRFWSGLALLPVLGIALSLAISFSDPSLHDRLYLPSALSAALWLLLVSGLVAGIVTAAWTRIASRVYGSWLLAIGMLYGGAYMASKQTTLTPPPFADPPAASDDFSGFEPLFKSLDRYGPQRPVLGPDLGEGRLP